MALRMDSTQIALLQDLMHIDLDAVTLYDAALRRLTSPLVEQALMEFRSDHLRHLRELGTHVERLGGERMHLEPSEEQCARHGFSPIQEGMSLEELITALADGESITNQVYERALRADWAPELRECIGRNFADEQRHLFWVLNASRMRLWERSAEQQPSA
jgi:rubrerythrin